MHIKTTTCSPERVNKFYLHHSSFIEFSKKEIFGQKIQTSDKVNFDSYIESVEFLCLNLIKKIIIIMLKNKFE